MADLPLRSSPLSDLARRLPRSRAFSSPPRYSRLSAVTVQLRSRARKVMTVSLESMAVFVFQE